MAYVPLTWDAATPLSVSNLNHMETQYTQMKAYLDAHNHDALYPTIVSMESTYYFADNDGTGSGANAETVDGYSLAQLQAAIPVGMIILYSENAGGAIANLTGWQLADGTNGTRDLREKYVQGADQFDVGETGGANTVLPTGNVTIAGHALTVAQLPVHNHSYVDRSAAMGAGNDFGSGARVSSGTTRTSGYYGTDPATAHGHPGSTVTFNGGVAFEKRPVSKVIPYIQRV